MECNSNHRCADENIIKANRRRNRKILIEWCREVESEVLWFRLRFSNYSVFFPFVYTTVNFTCSRRAFLMTQ